MEYAKNVLIQFKAVVYVNIISLCQNYNAPNVRPTCISIKINKFALFALVLQF